MKNSTSPEVCRRRFVLVAGALLGGLAGELAYVAVRAVGSPWVASGIVALAAGLGISLLFVRKGGTGVGAPIHCGGLAVFAALALLCVVQTARAGGFMLRPEMPGWSLLPSNSFLVHHNCFTAYYEAARLVDQDPNVYDPVMYRPPPGPPGRAPAPGHTLDGFNVDHFEYPPTFLLLPRAAILAGASFLQARAEWFVFQTAAVILALLMVAWHLGGPAGWRFGSLAPLIYLAVAQQVALQISNFQPAAIALTMIALVTIARGRQVLGAS